MALKIGIPRALFYFHHPGIWERFFARLGLGVELSAPTTRKTVDLAAEISEAEHCLPVKIVHAHLAELAGQVDRLFVPRILSTLDGHMACPKLASLPDIARIEFGERTPILTVEIDAERRSLARSMAELGRSLGAGWFAARRSARLALAPTAPWSWGFPKGLSGSGGRRVLVLSHPYNLYDEHIAGPVVGKLERLGVGVELLALEEERVPSSFIKWDTSARMYRKLLDLEPGSYAGIIQISSFNCGCDSMSLEFFRDVLAGKGVPYMILMVDEHTAQAGVETRLEAFVDSWGG
jgi:predicted nucleotide-binding protein (sugar kinase/HSP70/actin superfamily)